jgi:hypothetical protein
MTVLRRNHLACESEQSDAERGQTGQVVAPLRTIHSGRLLRPSDEAKAGDRVAVPSEIAIYNHKGLISCVSSSARDERREVNSPEVCGPVRKFDSHGRFAVVCGAYIYHPAFLLLPGVLVFNEKRLPFFYSSGERQQSPVSIHGKRARQLAEGFSRHSLPVDQHRYGQFQPRASSYSPLRVDLRRRNHKRARVMARACQGDQSSGTTQSSGGKSICQKAGDGLRNSTPI